MAGQGEAADMALGSLISSKMEIVGRRAEEELRQMKEEDEKARMRQEQGMMQRNLASNLASIQGGEGAGRVDSLAAGQGRGAGVSGRAGAGEMGKMQGPEAKESFRIGGGDVTMLPAKVEFQFPDARNPRKMVLGVSHPSIVMNRDTSRGGTNITVVGPSKYAEAVKSQEGMRMSKVYDKYRRNDSAVARVRKELACELEQRVNKARERVKAKQMRAARVDAVHNINKSIAGVNHDMKVDFRRVGDAELLQLSHRSMSVESRATTPPGSRLNTGSGKRPELWTPVRPINLIDSYTEHERANCDTRVSDSYSLGLLERKGDGGGGAGGGRGRERERERQGERQGGRWSASDDVDEQSGRLFALQKGHRWGKTVKKDSSYIFVRKNGMAGAEHPLKDDSLNGPDQSDPATKFLVHHSERSIWRPSQALTAQDIDLVRPETSQAMRLIVGVSDQVENPFRPYAPRMLLAEVLLNPCNPSVLPMNLPRARMAQSVQSKEATAAALAPNARARTTAQSPTFARPETSWGTLGSSNNSNTSMGRMGGPYGGTHHLGYTPHAADRPRTVDPLSSTSMSMSMSWNEEDEEDLGRGFGERHAAAAAAAAAAAGAAAGGDDGGGGLVGVSLGGSKRGSWQRQQQVGHARAVKQGVASPLEWEVPLMTLGTSHGSRDGGDKRAPGEIPIQIESMEGVERGEVERGEVAERETAGEVNDSHGEDLIHMGYEGGDVDIPIRREEFGRGSGRRTGRRMPRALPLLTPYGEEDEDEDEEGMDVEMEQEEERRELINAWRKRDYMHGTKRPATNEGTRVHLAPRPQSLPAFSGGPYISSSPPASATHLAGRLSPTKQQQQQQRKFWKSADGGVALTRRSPSKAITISHSEEPSAVKESRSVSPLGAAARPPGSLSPSKGIIRPVIRGVKMNDGARLGAEQETIKATDESEHSLGKRASVVFAP